LARLGIVPRHRLELPSNGVLVCALKRGYGIAAISRYVVAAELRTGPLAVVHVRGWNVQNIVFVLRVRDAKSTPSADRFQAFVRMRLGEKARQRARRQTVTFTATPEAGIIMLAGIYYGSMYGGSTTRVPASQQLSVFVRNYRCFARLASVTICDGEALPKPLSHHAPQQEIPAAEEHRFP
jgi:hypothetical protein